MSLSSFVRHVLCPGTTVYLKPGLLERQPQYDEEIDTVDITAFNKWVACALEPSDIIALPYGAVGYHDRVSKRTARYNPMPSIARYPICLDFRCRFESLIQKIASH